MVNRLTHYKLFSLLKLVFVLRSVLHDIRLIAAMNKLQGIWMSTGTWIMTHLIKLLSSGS